MAHPFQKMKTHQLRRLLQDDEKQDRRLKQSSHYSAKTPPAIESLRINPAAPRPSEISTEPC